MDAAELLVKENNKPRRQAYAEKGVDLSVVVPVCERHDDIRQLYLRYAEEIRQTGYSCEFIFVVDGGDKRTPKSWEYLNENDSKVQVLTLNRLFGEATALAVGFEKARAPVIVTLPAYFQVEPYQIREFIDKLLKDDLDLVISWRRPRTDSLFGQAKSWAFHRLVRMLTGTAYHDLTCRLRVMKRKVAEEVALYGDLHYFFPLFAYQRGFKIAELPVQSSRRDSGRHVYQPSGYLRRLLDLFNLFFLFKFTRKPLRFFGSAGLGLFTCGDDHHRLFGAIPVAGLWRDISPPTVNFGSIADRAGDPAVFDRFAR